MNELSEQQKQELHKELLDLRDELQKLLADSSDGAQPVSLDEPIGRLSRMDAMQAQAMSVETGRRRRQKLAQIEAALKRIEADEFGYCQECGEEIAPARLQIDPTAQLCIGCASARESMA